MDFPTFDNGIKQYQYFNNHLEKLKEDGLNLYDTDLIDKAYRMFDTWIETILNEEGQDLMYWWLFEDVDKILYEEGEPNISVEDIKDLYDYMQSNKMFNL